MALLRLISADDKEDKEKKDYKRKPIKFFINSNGGNVSDMFSIIDIIENSKTPIYTYCTGKAHSCGGLLLMSGIKRFISPHALVLIHSASSGTYGKIQAMVETIEQYQKEQKMLENYIVSKTKITQERLDKVRENKIDWFLTAQDCLDLGVADDWFSNESKYFEDN